jgi:mRNA-degrading endonuclease YafQ of YafQ-DinJ toxin-antitoxin module
VRTVVLASSFQRAFKRLVGRQPQLQQRIQERLALLTADPFDPLLQTHKLKGKLSGAWACSVDYDCRIVFNFVQNIESGLDGCKQYNQICHLSARSRSQLMKVQYPLFSQVALAQDIPEYNLKRGNVATIVEHYPMPEGEEDGYSLEGFDLPHVTIEVPASQIIPIAQWQQEEMILAKLRQLSEARLLQLQDYLDFLLQKEESEHQSRFKSPT